jgi:hypothetical protein
LDLDLDFEGDLGAATVDVTEDELSSSPPNITDEIFRSPLLIVVMIDLMMFRLL